MIYSLLYSRSTSYFYCFVVCILVPYVLSKAIKAIKRNQERENKVTH